MQERKSIVAGGVSLIVAALGFVVVFSYLAAKFSYPDILDGAASEVLPRLRSGGADMRAIWAIYSLLPLLILPGAVGARLALKSSRGAMTLALVFASISAFAMCLGLMRWPSVHWALAQAYERADQSAIVGIEAVFDGLNLYLGNYIGEFLGELCLAGFFLCSGVAGLKEAVFPGWFGWSGIGFGSLFLIGAFRNVLSVLQPVADLNNVLLPLWLLVFGVGLIRYSNARSRAA